MARHGCVFTGRGRRCWNRGIPGTQDQEPIRSPAVFVDATAGVSVLALAVGRPSEVDCAGYCDRTLLLTCCAVAGNRAKRSAGSLRTETPPLAEGPGTQQLVGKMSRKSPVCLSVRPSPCPILWPALSSYPSSSLSFRPSCQILGIATSPNRRRADSPPRREHRR